VEASLDSETCAQPGDAVTGNVVPLLHEIRHALQRWLEKEERCVIDLRSLPLGPGEEERIIDELGEGEVRAQLSALGPSEVCETRFPGVWLVTHYNSNEEIIGRFVEICDMPSILKSQAGDIQDGLQRLEAQLV